MPREEGWGSWTDARLVQAVGAGEREAYAELYRRHARAVRMAVSDHVHDPERQRDLIQDAFLRALRKLPSLRDPDRFRPWLLQIARNAAVDDLRARRVARFEELDPDEHVAADRPEDESELRELAAVIDSGMATLSARDAAALSMTVHLGFGPAEIAHALGLSHTNAKVVLHRARRRLRAAMGSDLRLVGTEQ